MWVLGIELTTSGLHGKHFVVWTISSERVPVFFVCFVRSIVFAFPICRQALTAWQLREYVQSTLEGSSYHKYNFNFIFHYQLSVLDSWVRKGLYLVDSFTNSLKKFFLNIYYILVIDRGLEMQLWTKLHKSFLLTFEWKEITNQQIDHLYSTSGASEGSCGYTSETELETLMALGQRSFYFCSPPSSPRSYVQGTKLCQLSAGPSGPTQYSIWRRNWAFSDYLVNLTWLFKPLWRARMPFDTCNISLS